MKIIGGIVRYEDGVKSTEGDQYSPTRKVAVELNFSLDDSDQDESDAAIQAVLDKAQAFVLGKLGVKTPSAAAAAKKTVAPVQGPKRPAAAPPKTKADMAREAGLPAESDANPAGDPAAIEEPTKADAAAVTDDFSLPAEEAAKPISDDEVNKRVQQVNAKLGDPVKIRGLIGEFKPKDWTKQFTLRDIPQASRPDFLAKLDALV